MIDVSDGLIADLGHIAQNSGVRVNLRSEAFVIADPVRAAAERIDTDPMTWMLTGGEDHALVATFAPGTVPEGWTVIGRVDAAAESDATAAVKGDPRMAQLLGRAVDAFHRPMLEDALLTVDNIVFRLPQQLLQDAVEQVRGARLPQQRKTKRFRMASVASV